MTEYGIRLIKEYKALVPKYEQFTADVSKLIETILSDNGIEYQAIEFRTKTIESFSEKVDRPDKAQKYASCNDVTDLSGIRLIVYLQEDRDKICSIIEANFSIDAVNSIKKDDSLNIDQFGYRSVHYVISYTDHRLDLPEFHKFRGLRAEIQVRTVLQHTWASIDWKLRYKNAFEVPKELKRKLYRISALLEVADDNFSELSDDVKKLRDSYKEKIDAGSFDIDINRESIELFLSEDVAVREILEIAKKYNYNISPPSPNARNPYNTLLLTLSYIEINRINTIKDLLDTFLSSGGISLKNIYKAWISPGKPKKLVIDSSGLIRICIITTISKIEAKKILEQNPFGPELQRAIIQILDE